MSRFDLLGCGAFEALESCADAEGGDGEEYDIMLFNVGRGLAVPGSRSGDEDREARRLRSEVRT